MEIPAPVHFAGLKFTPLDRETATCLLDQRPSSAAFDYVVTPNVDHVVRLSRQHACYRPLYDDALMCLCDSAILAVLMRLLGIQTPKTPGSDLVEQILSESLRPGDTITIIGCDREVVAALHDHHPEIVIQHHEPPMNLLHDPGAIDRSVRFVAAHPARFVFLCVGSPQQEVVAQSIKLQGGATGIGICCGISLHYAAGSQRRAPLSLRRLGLEWFYRLISEPRRLWRRYMVEGLYIILVFLKEVAQTVLRRPAENR